MLIVSGQISLTYFTVPSQISFCALAFVFLYAFSAIQASLLTYTLWMRIKTDKFFSAILICYLSVFQINMNRLGHRVLLQSTVSRSYSTNEACSNTRRPSKLIDEIIRVDHAGELGADRIYAGQVAVLGNTKIGPTLKHMWEQERIHRQEFEKFIGEYRVRPTVMTPIWNIAGFALGAGTALMGEKAAMACTVAVETVIVEHYNEQLRQIMESPNVDKVREFFQRKYSDVGRLHNTCQFYLYLQQLLDTITKFRDEEQEHHDTGIDHGAEQAPFYKAMTEVIKLGCKTAIAISKKI